MCSRLIVLRPVLQAMETLAGMAPHMTPFQWDVMELAETLLKPFHAAQELLQGEKYPTASLLPIIVSSLRTRVQEIATALPPSPSEELATDALVEFAATAARAAAAADAAEARAARAQLGGALGDLVNDDDDVEEQVAAAVASPAPAFAAAAKEAIRQTAMLMLKDIQDRWGTGAPVRLCIKI
jgi:hypothetical protein